MRLPFDINGPKFRDEARVTFSFHSPEFNQNIEISIDGDQTSVETLCDAFQRFLGALGISFPDNVVLSFIELDEDELEEEDDDLDDEEDDDKPDNKKGKKK
jgi:hypothetical protein